MKLFLGSSSQWRRGILDSLGISYEAVSADIDEKAIRHEDVQVMVKLIAEAKADALYKVIEDSSYFLITGDQVVTHKGVVREKPVDEAEAKTFLKSYCIQGDEGGPAVTVTAVCLSRVENGSIERVTENHESRVFFKTIPEHVIDELIRKGDVMTCSGGFTVNDEILRPFVDRIDGTIDSGGSYFANC